VAQLEKNSLFLDTQNAYACEQL